MDYRMNAHAERKDEIDLSKNTLDLKTMQKRGN